MNLAALCTAAAKPLSLLRWKHISSFRGPKQPRHQPKRVSSTRPAAATDWSMDGAPASSAGSAAAAEAVVLGPDGSLPRPMKLSVVVHDALRRWYLETEREAQRGDVKSQALLGQMLMEGYGCTADPEKGREWAEKARRRGYRMQGVYCRI